MSKQTQAIFLLGVLLLSNETVAFTGRSSTATNTALQPQHPMRAFFGHNPTALEMQPSNQHLDFKEEISHYSTTSSNSRRQRRDFNHPLRAVAIGSLSDLSRDIKRESISADVASDLIDGDKSDFLQVLSAASLVTSSMVGAGMLILPDLAAGPGFAATSGLFACTYALVLISGLVIADVAINQHESGYDVPSSFQDFAEATLESEWMAQAVSVIPVVVHSLVMVFAVSKAGELGSAALSSMANLRIDPLLTSAAFLGVIGAMLSTLNGAKLSNVSSVCVSALLLSFGGLLLPGLAAVHDPVGTFLAPGQDGDQWTTSLATLFPIALTALQFQGIVPSIAKILDFDRKKTVAAIVLGSFLSLTMYLGWCFAVMGGGVDLNGALAGPLMAVFSGTTLFGSSLGCSMGVAEEVQTFVSKAPEDEYSVPAAANPVPKKDVFSIPAVLMSLAVPMAGIVAFSGGNDATVALGLAGSFGSPILYGLIPAMMSFNQNKKRIAEEVKSLVPGGGVGVGALGLGAAAYIGEGMASHMTEVMGTVAS